MVTNSPEHDPDIQHLPFFAISPRFFNSIRSSYHKRILQFDAFTRTVLPHQSVQARLRTRVRLTLRHSSGIDYTISSCALQEPTYSFSPTFF